MWFGTTAALCLAASHIVYGIVYKRPSFFSQYIPYPLFVRWAIAWRGASLFLCMLYICYHKEWQIFHIHLPSAIHGVPWFVIGQLLNYSVYKKIGVSGVYYGRELGVIPASLPFVQGFPFIIPHPMYVGACMSIYGTLQIMGYDRSGNIIPAAWWLGLLGWTLYGFTMWVEK